MSSVSTGGGGTGGCGGRTGVSSAGISGCPPLISACNCLSLVLLLPLPVGCGTGVSAGFAAARWKPPAGTATGLLLPPEIFTTGVGATFVLCCTRCFGSGAATLDLRTAAFAVGAGGSGCITGVGSSLVALLADRARSLFGGGGGMTS